MTIQQKIEIEIKRLEEVLQNVDDYKTIQALLKNLEQNPIYITLQSLKNILAESEETTKPDDKSWHVFKANRRNASTRPGPGLKTIDTSHYGEMLSFLEAHMELDPGPIHVKRLHNIAIESGYAIGGKNPVYNLGSYLSRDPRFTATNKGWILTKHVTETQTDNS